MQRHKQGLPGIDGSRVYQDGQPSRGFSSVKWLDVVDRQHRLEIALPVKVQVGPDLLR